MKQGTLLMTDITQPYSKLILSAKTVSGTAVSRNTRSQETDFCNMCKLHQKTDFKFLLYISTHIRTHALETAVPNNRRQNQDPELT